MGLTFRELMVCREGDINKNVHDFLSAHFRGVQARAAWKESIRLAEENRKLPRRRAFQEAAHTSASQAPAQQLWQEASSCFLDEQTEEWRSDWVGPCVTPLLGGRWAAFLTGPSVLLTVRNGFHRKPLLFFVRREEEEEDETNVQDSLKQSRTCRVIRQWVTFGGEPGPWGAGSPNRA